MFSVSSREKLQTCDSALVKLFSEVVKEFDCKILEGHRSLKDQEKLFNEKKSKVKNGKHNHFPSKAVDVSPYPIDWNDTNRFYYFAGFVLGKASSLGINIRWGGDWSMDTQVKDQTFNDLVHFELV